MEETELTHFRSLTMSDSCRDQDSVKQINPLTVVKKLRPYPVLWGPHGPWGLFQVKHQRNFLSVTLHSSKVMGRDSKSL